MQRPKCKTCPFWDQLPNSPMEGTCRRHPPAPSNTPGDFGRWPFTLDSAFCGEHPDFPAYIASQTTVTVEVES